MQCGNRRLYCLFLAKNTHLNKIANAIAHFLH